MKKEQPRWVGTLSVIIAASLWATTGIVARYAYARAITPLLLTTARINMAWLLITAFLLLTDRPALRVQAKDLLSLAFFGIIGIGLTQFTYLFTMTQTSVGIAVLLQSLSPAFIYLYSLLSRQEMFRPAKMVVLLLAFAGGLLITMGAGGWGATVSPLGLATGVLSALCWAFYAVAAKPLLERYAQWTLLFWGTGFASLSGWILTPPWHIAAAMRAEPIFFLAVMYLALFCTFIPSGLYLGGIKLLLPSTAGILAASEPVVAALLAYVLLQESMTLVQILGGLLILIALVLLQGADGQAKAKTTASA